MVAEDQKKEVEEKIIIQDGQPVPQRPPWPKIVWKVSTLPFIVVFFLGLHILSSQGNIINLLGWLFVWIVLVFPLRYLTCARCPYYGERCSSGFGKLVTYLFRKQEEKSMVFGLWLDLVCFVLIFLIPLPSAWRLGGFLLALGCPSITGWHGGTPALILLLEIAPKYTVVIMTDRSVI